MADRDPSYDDKYGAALDTSRAGQVTVTVDSVTVTEPRRAGWEASDDQRALFIALETARNIEDRVSRVTDTECERARAEWKAAAYEKHVSEDRRNPELDRKLAYWTAERDRLRQRDTTRTQR